MTDIRKLFAENLKLFRGRLGLSQARLAEKAETAPNYIAMIETGKRFPTPAMIHRLAAALNVDSPELFSADLVKNKTVSKVQETILAEINEILTKRLSELSKTL
ncbi:MAG: helix-turn-helix domain-containing protein [Spirochaetaceae bacterium]|jgi:transcriptional regulator with XRE-family HTH domain|nr:helix-turn-helix domain-containing protein [Spirochaetaceae bacterium]